MSRSTVSSVEVQHMICALMIPIIGDKLNNAPLGADSTILDQIDSLEAMEVIIGLEELFPEFDMDELDFHNFGPTISDAADAVVKVILKC